MPPSLYSESEIQIVTPFEDKHCFSQHPPAVPPSLSLYSPLSPTHVAWPHLAKSEINEEYKRTEKCS